MFSKDDLQNKGKHLGMCLIPRVRMACSISYVDPLPLVVFSSGEVLLVIFS